MKKRILWMNIGAMVSAPMLVLSCTKKVASEAKFDENWQTISSVLSDNPDLFSVRMSKSQIIHRYFISTNARILTSAEANSLFNDLNDFDLPTSYETKITLLRKRDENDQINVVVNLYKSGAEVPKHPNTLNELPIIVPPLFTNYEKNKYSQDSYPTTIENASEILPSESDNFTEAPFKIQPIEQGFTYQYIISEDADALDDLGGRLKIEIVITAPKHHNEKPLYHKVWLTGFKTKTVVENEEKNEENAPE